MNHSIIKKHKDKVIFAIPFFIVLLLTSLCPYLSDDYHFFFIWKDFNATNNETIISSFSDIIISARNYYMLSGGRVLCHFILFIFLQLPKYIFNIVNAFFYSILCYEVYSLTQINRIKNFFLSLAVILSLFFLKYPFGDDILWMSGSINYLWPCVLFLFVIMLIDKWWDTPTLKHQIILYFLVFLSSLTNEITGGMIVCYIIITSIAKYNKQSVLRYIPSVFLSIFAILIVILAPGNQHRASIIHEYSKHSYERFFYVFGRLTDTFLSNNIILLFGIISISIFMYSKKFDIKKILFDLRFAIIGIIGVYALTLSFVYTERPLLFGTILTIINFYYLFSSLINYIKIENEWKKANNYIIFLRKHAICSFLFAFCCIEIGELILSSIFTFVFIVELIFIIKTSLIKHLVNIKKINKRWIQVVLIIICFIFFFCVIQNILYNIEDRNTIAFWFEQLKNNKTNNSLGVCWGKSIFTPSESTSTDFTYIKGWYNLYLKYIK